MVTFAHIRMGTIAAVTLLTATATSAQAIGPVPVLDLQFNETAGATTATDASGFGHHAKIGSHLVMNGSYARFDRHPRFEGIAYGDEHLITIPDASDGSLDPGRGNFSVELRYRTRHTVPNIMQKGQAGTRGGQVKLQHSKGKMQCMFRTPQGRATAGSGVPLNDYNWHTVRCVRTPTSVTLYVDGVRAGRSNNTTGTLNNTKPWSIGGKSECDRTTIKCDYFTGDIDYVRITKG